MIHTVRYSGIASDGGTTEVTVFVDTVGSTTTRTLSDGDRFLGVTETGHGILYDVVVDVLRISAQQPEPGDVVVVSCPPDDVLFLSGGAAVVTDGGPLQALNFNQFDSFFSAKQASICASVEADAQPEEARTWTAGEYHLNDGDAVRIVSADTADGDVRANLPAPNVVRMVSFQNRVGTGTLEINAGDHLIDGEHTALFLAPGDHVTVGSFGGGWGIFG